MARGKAQAFLALGSPLSFAYGAQLAALAVKYRLPGVFDFKENAEAGGLMSYGIDISDSMRRSAAYVDKILKGAKPAELPVEEAAKFEMIVNLKTARALGLSIPQSILTRADRVIE
jgi:putative ABC transport system substrate-binding protein